MCQLHSLKIRLATQRISTPRGILKIYMMGGKSPIYFFGLKIQMLGAFWGSRDWSLIFLGLKIICELVWVASMSEWKNEETLTDIQISLAY